MSSSRIFALSVECGVEVGVLSGSLNEGAVLWLLNAKGSDTAIHVGLEREPWLWLLLRCWVHTGTGNVRESEKQPQGRLSPVSGVLLGVFAGILTAALLHRLGYLVPLSQVGEPALGFSKEPPDFTGRVSGAVQPWELIFFCWCLGCLLLVWGYGIFGQCNRFWESLYITWGFPFR